VLKSNDTGNQGVNYFKENEEFWSYVPGQIKLKADYALPVDVDLATALASGVAGNFEREVEKKTYVVEENGVKKIIQEEIETVKLPVSYNAGAGVNSVAFGNLEQARTIKLSHKPVVSEREKKQIESLDKKNIFSFLGCFGGRKEAFF
jgi:hypothetical protein